MSNKSTRKLLKKRSEPLTGFTLIEILFTITFLFVGLLALLQAFPTALGLEKINQMKSQAVLLAQEKMEFISSKAYQDVAVEDVLEDVLPSPFQLFSRRVKVTYVDADLQTTGSDLGLKKIEVTVSWKTALPFAPKDLKISGLIASK